MPEGAEHCFYFLLIVTLHGNSELQSNKPCQCRSTDSWEDENLAERNDRNQCPSHELYLSSLIFNSCIIAQINLKNNNKQILRRCWYIIHHIMINTMLELVGSLVFQPTYKTVKQTKTVSWINFYSNINISLQKMCCLQHTMYWRYILCQSEECSKENVI